MIDFEKIQFMADGVELTQDAKEYVIKKLTSIERLINNNNDNVRFEVIFESDKPNEQIHSTKFKTHITIYSGSSKVHAIGHGDTIFAATDEAKDELERRLRREKRKRITLFKKGARKIKELLRWGK